MISKIRQTFLVKYHLYPPGLKTRLRMAVRRYMTRLDGVLMDGFEDHLFEHNNEKTWDRIVRDSNWIIETLNFLMEIEGSSLVEILPRYKVICDWTNNTAESMNKDVVNIDVHLKFDRSMVDCNFQ